MGFNDIIKAAHKAVKEKYENKDNKNNKEKKDVIDKTKEIFADFKNRKNL